MPRNPSLEVIYAAREELLADAGGDARRYIQEANARALASGRLIAPPKIAAAEPNDADANPTTEASISSRQK